MGDPLHHHVANLALVDKTKKLLGRDSKASSGLGRPQKLNGHLHLQGLIESKFTTEHHYFVLELGHHCQVVALHKSIASVLKRCKQVQRLLQAVQDLAGRLNWCHAPTVEGSWDSVIRSRRAHSRLG